MRYDVAGPAVSEQLDRALTRNARYAVLLRHTAAKLHQAAAGHARAVNWSICNHEDCRKVADLLGERKAT